MSTLQLNGKDLASQTSSDEPVIASTVTGAPALALTNATGTMPTGTQDNITRLGTVTVGNLSNTAIVYPTGHMVNSKWFLDTAGSYSSTDTSEIAIHDAHQITVTSGNTIVIGCVAYFSTGNTGGANLNTRFGKVYLRRHSGTWSQGNDLISTGTKVFACQAGHDDGNTEFLRENYNNIHGMGAWVADTTTYYVGTTMSTSHTSLTSSIAMTAADPFYFYYYELKGDVMP